MAAYVLRRPPSPEHRAAGAQFADEVCQGFVVGVASGAKINGKSPTAQRMLKYSFNLIDDWSPFPWYY
jgi:hypothetical protein